MKADRIDPPGKSERIAGILLTAGLSSRMGTFKPLLPWGNKTLIESVLGQSLQSRLFQVLLVLGCGAEEIRRRIDLFDSHPKLRILENPDYRKGISTSIRTGLESIGDEAGIMFLLGDQPFVTSQVIDRLIRVFTCGSAAIVAPLFGKHRGHPVIFRDFLIPELRQLIGDTGGRELIRKYREQVQLVPIHPHWIGRDIDTWEDYRELLTLQTGSRPVGKGVQ